MDSEPHTVVGVLGHGPADHQQNKVWLPLAFTEQELQSGNISLHVMARLKEMSTRGRQCTHGGIGRHDRA